VPAGGAGKAGLGSLEGGGPRPRVPIRTNVQPFYNWHGFYQDHWGGWGTGTETLKQTDNKKKPMRSICLQVCELGVGLSHRITSSGRKVCGKDDWQVLRHGDDEGDYDDTR